MTSRKFEPNTRLKLAIVASRKTQRVIATKTRIPEMRLSKIVTGREQANPKEQTKLARALQVNKSDLFPTFEVESDAQVSA